MRSATGVYRKCSLLLIPQGESLDAYLKGAGLLLIAFLTMSRAIEYSTSETFVSLRIVYLVRSVGVMYRFTFGNDIL